MKAKWMDEVADILQSGRFTSWYARVQSARRDLEIATEKHEELLTQVNLLQFRAEIAHRKAIDTLERANMLEDDAQVISNEAANLDNASFESVSQFEIQRKRCTDLWERLGALDVQVDATSDLSTKSKLVKQREKLGEEYEREDQKKRKLWSEFEGLVVRNTDRALALREKNHKAKLVRIEAERLFALHEQEVAQATRLRAEAEKMSHARERAEGAVVATLDDAKRELECILGEDFLYWPAREDNKQVYATPLLDDKSSYAVPLTAGKLYRCDPRHGIDGLAVVEVAVRREDSVPEPSPTT